MGYALNIGRARQCPLKSPGQRGFVKCLLGAVHENTLTAPMRHEQAVSSFSVAAFATGPRGHRRSRR